MIETIRGLGYRMDVRREIRLAAFAAAARRGLVDARAAGHRCSGDRAGPAGDPHYRGLRRRERPRQRAHPVRGLMHDRGALAGEAGSQPDRTTAAAPVRPCARDAAAASTAFTRARFSRWSTITDLLLSSTAKLPWRGRLRRRATSRTASRPARRARARSRAHVSRGASGTGGGNGIADRPHAPPDDHHLARARAAASGSVPGARCDLHDAASALIRTLLRLNAERGLTIENHVDRAHQ